MSLKPVRTRRTARPVGHRNARRPLDQRATSRTTTTVPLAPTFARAERRRHDGR